MADTEASLVLSSVHLRRQGLDEGGADAFPSFRSSSFLSLRPPKTLQTSDTVITEEKSKLPATKIEGALPEMASLGHLSRTPPIDLTEENIRQVLVDARSEFGQLFDASVGITGEVDLAELDGPFVKIRLKGRFWHKRSTVLDRISNYLKNRIPEILEVDIEDEKQLDDSPENF